MCSNKGLCLALIMAWASLAPCPIGAAPAPPPMPPEGWENQALAGFEPGIESTLIELSRATDSQINDRVWESWGPGAVSRLGALYRDASWTGFRASVVRLLAAEPSGQGEAMLHELLLEALANTEQHEPHSSHLHLITTYVPRLGNAAIPLVQDSLAALGGKEAFSPQEIARVERMALALRTIGTPEAVRLLEQHSLQANEPVRWSCIQALSAIAVTKGVAAARILVENARDDALRAQATGFLKVYEPHARAQERMSIVLEKENIPDGKMRSRAKVLKTPKSKARTAPLREKILAWPPSRSGANHWDGAGILSLATEIAVLEQDKSIGFFENLATDPVRPYPVRRDAVIALTHIGTTKSVAAYKKLRDAAQLLPGAPPRLDNPTHAQKMLEALQMTHFIISGNSEHFETTIGTPSITVSEDYRTGSIWVHSGHVSREIKSQRFGDEWLIVGFGQIIS